MSRIAKSPITIPDSVEVSQSGEVLTVKGKLGEMTMNVHSSVTIKNTDNVLTFFPVKASQKEEKSAWAQAGTCLLYTSPSPRDRTRSRMPSSA